MTKRRTFLYGAAAFAGVCAVDLLSGSQAPDRGSWAIANTKQARISPTSLRARAAAKGLLYGAAIESSRLSNDAFANLVAQQCNILVPENELKWRSLRPAPDRYNFSGGDRLAEFARQNDMQFRGHTLVWHNAIPDWLPEVANRSNAEKLLTDHITAVAGHYAGRIHSWDVVNEAVFPGSEGVNGLRNSLWLQLLGPEYIDIAFQAAAAADPNAMLVYNDYGLDLDNDDQNARKARVLRLLEGLKSRGVPIHALGTQSHLWSGESRLNPESLRAFLRDVASLDLKILVTELDVVDRNAPRDIAERDRAVAETYRTFLDIVLDEPAVIGVLTWGLSDRYTWLSQSRPRRDNAPVRPLPFDDQMRPKPASEAIAAAFDATFRRS